MRVRWCPSNSLRFQDNGKKYRMIINHIELQTVACRQQQQCKQPRHGFIIINCVFYCVEIQFSIIATPTCSIYLFLTLSLRADHRAPYTFQCLASTHQCELWAFEIMCDWWWCMITQTHQCLFDSDSNSQCPSSLWANICFESIFHRNFLEHPTHTNDRWHTHSCIAHKSGRNMPLYRRKDAIRTHWSKWPISHRRCQVLVRITCALWTRLQNRIIKKNTLWGKQLSRSTRKNKEKVLRNRARHG